MPRATYLPLNTDNLKPTLGNLHDFFRPDASCADLHPLHTAVDERTNALKIRIKPPGPHIVRMRDAPANYRAFSTDIAALRHN